MKTSKLVYGGPRKKKPAKGTEAEGETPDRD
jgi:hypothetical protein